MSKPIGIALIGAGDFAIRGHLPAIAAASSTFTLKAVYSRSAASAASVVAAAANGYPSQFHGIDTYSDADDGLAKLLAREDIHAVVLSLPILFQPVLIEKAWEAGKSVISEKPIAENVDEAKRLISLYETVYKPKGIQWIVAEQYPYDEAFDTARQILASGKIGELKSFTLDYNNYYGPGNTVYETVWRKDCQFQGGFLLDGGVHFVGALRHILDSPLATISGQVTQVAPHLYPSDLLHAIATTSSGVHGSIRISWGIPSSMRRWYSFYGTLGRIDVDWSPNDTDTFTVTTTMIDGSQEVTGAVAQGVIHEFAYFGRALQNPGGPDAKEVIKRSGPRATLRDLAVIQSALHSKGALVDVLASLGEFADDVE